MVFRAGHEGLARRIASVLGAGATVRKLTWRARAAVLVALGAPTP